MQNTLENNKNRVAIYMRSHLNDKKSIQYQRNDINRYLNEHPQYEIVDEFIDKSGDEEFKKMMKNALKGKYDIIVTPSHSVFASDIDILIKSLNKLNQFEKPVVVDFVKNHMKSIDPEFQFTIAVMGNVIKYKPGPLRTEFAK